MRAKLLALSVVTCLSSVAACDEEDVRTFDNPGQRRSGDGANGGGGGGEAGPAVFAATLVGSVTWTLSFDEEAKANGATDCAYTRHYDGVESGAQPWACTGCEAVFEAAVTMENIDCYAQLLEPGSGPATEAVEPVEFIGWGGEDYYRGVGGPMSEAGVATVDDDRVTVSDAVEDDALDAGGTVSFSIGGEFVRGQVEADPQRGLVPPADGYACGWPTSESAPYDGGYRPGRGERLPDGIFFDHCEEPVRLYDFSGRYFMVSMSAIDCPPCQALASQKAAFVSDMAGRGVEVEVITLLAPSLTNVFGETTQDMLRGWVSRYRLNSPVLADRGWGQSVLPSLLGRNEGVAYPSWALVAPDLTIFDAGEGLEDFTSIEESILAHAGN